MKKIILLLVCSLFLLSGCFFNKAINKRIADGVDLILDRTYESADGESSVTLNSDLTYKYSDCNAEGCMLYTGSFYIEGSQLVLEQKKYSATGEEKDLVDSDNTTIYDINSNESFDKFTMKK